MTRKALLLGIDACRTSNPVATLGNKTAPSAGLGAAADTASITFVFSCAGGEFSHATDGDDPHSVFIRALRETLSAADADRPTVMLDYPKTQLPGIVS